MITKEKKILKPEKIAEAEYLAIILSKLEGRDLFPEKTERAKKHLIGVKFSNI